MDFMEAKDTFVPVEQFDIQDTGQTSDNFQKFIYDLFDKNGIINDLRAYLRGHIVNVLKCAETGNLPACQKHFTQRLQLPFQALNILIVEYLLTMEFKYTLSVFISEIPLANMVFEFTKALLNLDTKAKMSSLQFKNEDIWSILNYLGLKCSSEHALKIVEIYKSEKLPLLLCILKCVSMYPKEEEFVEHISDQSTITQSSYILDDRRKGSYRHNSNCKHFMFCRACQNRVGILKEKYKRKKTRMEKKKRSNVKKVNVETFMNNVSDLEQTFIDEMFQQLKMVYESEVKMIKEQQHKKVKQSIASHALQLQKHREKQSFKSREEELSQAIHQKKQFLWGLACSLRDQHAHLTHAMTDVQRQTELLTHKESSLKTQLEEAEQTLKRRSEDMRIQISKELVIMEGHLATMKKERDHINEERKELENLKNSDATPTEKDLGSQYEFLKTELAILRKYVEAKKLDPKCIIEAGTVADFGNKYLMNNENIIKKEKIENNRVINDLKKQNNTNFNQLNFDDVNNTTSERPSTVSSVGDTVVVRDDTEDILNRPISDVDKVYIQDRHLRVGDIQDGPRGAIQGRQSEVDTLKQENNRLKKFAGQQREYIQALFNEKDRLQRALTRRSRPRTAPVVSNYSAGHRGVPDARASCPQSCANGQSFGSAAGGSSTGRDTRGRWVRRASGTTLPLHVAELVSNLLVDDTDIRRPDGIYKQNISNVSQGSNQNSASEAGEVREKCPKLQLREIKEKLQNGMQKKQSKPKTSDESSDAVIRNAKRRLRKLEIEAEAVEKSYQDFRKRQIELKEERKNIDPVRENLIDNVDKLDVKHKLFENYENKTTYEKNLLLSFPKESPQAMKNDFDKYFKEYSANLDFSQSRFANKNSFIKNVKPIPSPFSSNKEVNYLETPLMEFRKLYQAQRTIKNKDSIVKDAQNEKDNSLCIIKSEKNTNFININQNKLELNDIIKTSLKPKLTVHKNNESTDTLIYNNIDTKNNLNNNEIITHNVIKEIDNNKNNLLMVEVENGCDNVVVPNENQSVLIVVESSVDNRDISDVEGEQVSTQMTIIVSPKNKDGSKDFESPFEIRSRSASPELSQTGASKRMFHTENKELSSIDLPLELSKERIESISEVEKNQDSLDDFSADVDNYNSPSEYGHNSPISLAKTTEDENFWES